MFNIKDRVALKKDVDAGRVVFYRVKKILESNQYIIGKCDCRPDLFITVYKDDLYSYDTARDIIKNR